MEPKDTSRPPLSLMVVEDDESANELIRQMLLMKFPEATIYPAYEGRMGVALFKEHMPDIVITDINMPSMDGIEMAREIRSIKPDMRFIVVTGYSDRKLVEKFQEIGFCDYILKPVVFEELFSAVVRCL